MMGLNEMSNHRVAAVAALLAVSVALAFFACAVLSGAATTGHADSEFKTDQNAQVRYAMNYAVDQHLYSFYEQHNHDQPVALSRADSDQ